MTAARPRGATLRVAAAQASSVPGDVDANVATAVSLAGAAAERDACVLVLPELFLTGYDPAVWLPEATLTTEDSRLAPLREATARYDVVVVAGAAVRRGGRADRGPVTLSLVGRCGASTFSGGSSVYDPEGRAVVRAADEDPGLVVADLTAAEVARVQEMNPIERDRLPSLGHRTRLTLGAP